jgi:hypothetical protein
MEIKAPKIPVNPQINTVICRMIRFLLKGEWLAGIFI